MLLGPYPHEPHLVLFHVRFVQALSTASTHQIRLVTRVSQPVVALDFLKARLHRLDDARDDRSVALALLAVEHDPRVADHAGVGPARDEQVAEHGAVRGHDGERLFELGGHHRVSGGRLLRGGGGRRDGGLRCEGCPCGRGGVLRC